MVIIWWKFIDILSWLGENKMCLTRVDKVYKGTSRTVRFGYKVFRLYVAESILFSAYSGPAKPLPEEKWLNEKLYRKDENKEFISSREGRYPLGWHVYLDKKDADELASWFVSIDFTSGKGAVWYVVRQVQCKGLLATGAEDDAPVEVYKYIKIEKEVTL